MARYFKNVPISEVFKLEDLVEYREGRIESRTLFQSEAFSVTLFAFDEGEEIGKHTTDGDALAYLLDGKAEITIGDENFELERGQAIVMPAGVPHSLRALEKFKMLLAIVSEKS